MVRTIADEIDKYRERLVQCLSHESQLVTAYALLVLRKVNDPALGELPTGLMIREEKITVCCRKLQCPASHTLSTVGPRADLSGVREPPAKFVKSPALTVRLISPRNDLLIQKCKRSSLFSADCLDSNTPQEAIVRSQGQPVTGMLRF
jgi:hypothetical protein